MARLVWGRLRIYTGATNSELERTMWQRRLLEETGN
jgi:hypothetical protein